MGKAFTNVSLQLHHKERMIAQKKKRIRSKKIESFFVASDGSLSFYEKKQTSESRALRMMK